MRKTVIAALAALVLLGAGCSSSSGSDSKGSSGSSSNAKPVAVDAWAVDFCGAYLGWTKDIKGLGQTVGTHLDTGSLAARKKTILGLFADASAKTKALIDDIGAAGVPDIEDGAGLVKALKGKFRDFDEAIQSARGEAEDLPTADATEFKTQVDAMVSTYKTATDSVGDSFAALDVKYGTPSLDDALNAHCTPK